MNWFKRYLQQAFARKCWNGGRQELVDVDVHDPVNFVAVGLYAMMYSTALKHPHFLHLRHARIPVHVEVHDSLVYQRSQKLKVAVCTVVIVQIEISDPHMSVEHDPLQQVPRFIFEKRTHTNSHATTALWCCMRHDS
jgi:hypothetical protein